MVHEASGRPQQASGELLIHAGSSTTVQRRKQLVPAVRSRKEISDSITRSLADLRENVASICIRITTLAIQQSYGTLVFSVD